METGDAWAAGLFEGEGSITSCGGRPRLQLKMTDPEPVNRFCSIMGGKVYGPYKNNSGKKDGYSRKPYMMWVAERYDAEGIFARMRPWLSEYRLQRYAEVFGA